jgi:hypothetical protein
VAEGARLESVYTGNRIVGSNPTLSANAAGRQKFSGSKKTEKKPNNGELYAPALYTA